MHLPFQQQRTFCAVPFYNGQQDIVVVGCPVDCATTFRSGTRMGPGAIRDMSLMLTDGVSERYPVDIRQFVGDAGDMALPTGNTEKALQRIEEDAYSFSKKHLVTLGGDHSITLGLLRALYKTIQKPIGVLHWDSHCDLWDSHFGEKYGHGTWLFHAIEEGIVDPTKTISIGVRSPCDLETAGYLARKGGITISAEQAMEHTTQITGTIIRTLQNTSCYMSLDIDCLDPAYAPGTGTPEIGGLSSMWLKKMFGNHLAGLDWIGMDCVEVSPPYDHANITSLAAATFVWQYLSMICHKKGGI